MARLSWNEIQDRAVVFSAKYKGETYEKGESQSFWSDFLHVFGIDRKRYGAFFEYAIKKNGGGQGFIDMFWPGKLLAEQKSAGRDLTKATTQAFDYLHNMPDHDLPIGIVVSDFATFQFIDLDTRVVTEFTLENLHTHVQLFGFLIEQQSKTFAEEAPVNRHAAEAMASLHNALRDTGYSGHDVELLLVRLVFCLFADDSGIFEQRSFEAYFYNRTQIDGTDFGPRLVKLFEVLNTPDQDRSTALDTDLKAFPYINGGLFAETIRTPDFTYAMRDALLKAMELDWSQVSPAIFGSMFQGVMDEKQRRNLGAHYTSEKNILKVIKPLFLDDLYDEFAKVKHRKSELTKFHDKLANLTFLDPACGCGNFLVITYRELRRLEHKVIDTLHGKNAGLFELGEHGVVKCDVNQMYGIELEEFPSLIAQTALWLTDHQMNNEFSKQTGQTYKRLPLKKHANIHHANALTSDWADSIAPAKLNYILGNPPFIGHQWRSAEQADQMTAIWGNDGAVRRLDYVTCWFKKAADYMQNNKTIQTALVATNSISQGEQVAPLWQTLFKQGISINFAHRTFKWTNDASGIAGVHCVIVGFSYTPKAPKKLYDYTDITGEPIEAIVHHINGYLVDAPDVFIASRATAPKDMPELVKGSQPTDGGHLILTPAEKDVLITQEPNSAKYIRQYMGGAEFINNIMRYCLWLKDITPPELQAMPLVRARLEQVRQARLLSPTSSVREYANYPSLFTQDRQPTTDYLAIPEVSSERREYIPIGYVNKDVIASNKLQIIREPNRYLFGILMSNMHMAWVRTVAGRLKSDYSYSPSVLYSFVLPNQVSNTQKALIEKLAQAILDARAQYPNATLAELYDPLTMPPILAKAHKTLDRAVDRLYRKEPFTGDPERVALLFQLYQQKTV